MNPLKDLLDFRNKASIKYPVQLPFLSELNLSPHKS